MRTARQYLSDTSGSVAVVFAIVTIMLCLVAGMAIDYSRAEHLRSDLQNSADAAALAGSSLIGATDAERIAAATNYFNENVDVAPPPIPDVTSSGGFVTVSVDTTIPTTLMQLVDITEVGISVDAQASQAVPPMSCVISLEESEFGLQTNSNSTLNTACGVQVNSGYKEAMFVNSDSHIVATSVSVHGDAVTNSRSTISPVPLEGAPQVADPLASLPVPAAASSACQYTDFTVNSGRSATMSPGVYCKKTLINSSSKATMLPGIYVFKEGEFEINSLSSVTGDGVMLYFADKDARLIVNSDSTFEITAPDTGAYAGILMFQSRDPSTLSAAPFIVNSSSTTKLEGVVYLPNGRLELNSIGTANSSASYTAIVANQMVLNSYGTFKVNANYAGGTPLPSLMSGLTGAKLSRLTR